jgi:hypothetical protein
MTANRYPGINPHLNSALQQQDWKGFHTAHLAHLAEAIDAQLPANYYAVLEDSIQMNVWHDAGKYTVADILVRQRDPNKLPESGTAVAVAEIAEPTLVFDVFEDDAFVPSVMIYHQDRPITRIELLSPANKYPGSHYRDYIRKREATLHDGLRLVEIDYLHEQSPVLSLLPSYPDRDEGALPYMILVSDPTKVFDGGMMYGFGVLDKLPVIVIPLEDKEGVVIDFGAVYQRTFGSSRFFREVLTRYNELPARFSRYSPEDQARIQQQMASFAAPAPPQE